MHYKVVEIVSRTVLSNGMEKLGYSNIPDFSFFCMFKTNNLDYLVSWTVLMILSSLEQFWRRV